MDEIVPLLHRYPADCWPTHVEWLGNAGGMSGAQFWRIEAPRGMLVLRRWPVEHPTAERLRLIHSVIRHAGRTLDFLPVPQPTRDGDTFVSEDGHLWELAPWMPGVADYERSPSEAKLRAAMTALARFHHAVADFPQTSEWVAHQLSSGVTAIPRRLARLRELSRERLSELSRAIDNAIWPEFAPLARRFLAAVPSAIPPVIARLEQLANINLPLQPCLRDIWHDHVLFTGSRVTGLIDFGAVDIDTPATDIARLLGSLAGEACQPFQIDPIDVDDRPEIWQLGLSAYSKTRQLTRNESDAVFAINAANPILAGCNWIQWIYIDRRVFQDPQRVQRRFERIVVQLTK